MAETKRMKPFLPSERRAFSDASIEKKAWAIAAGSPSAHIGGAILLAARGRIELTSPRQ